MIPKKFHFTYSSACPPPKYQSNLSKWSALHSDWDIHYYSDAAVQTFFDTHFPEYASEIPKISFGATKADLFRYAALYVYGGVYTDIDTTPVKKIPEEWLSKSCVFGYEYQPSKFPESMRHPWRDEEFFCQWTLLSAPQFPLYKEALDQAMEGLRAANFEIKKGKAFILKVAGPLHFTRVAQSYTDREDVLVLDADYFGSNEAYDFPLTDRSVVSHQFDGHQGWELQMELPHLRLTL